MKMILRLTVLVALTAALGGCASVVQGTVKYLYGDSPYTQDAVKAAAIGMTAYDSFIQPRIEDYGGWPKPGTSACAAVKTTLLCRNQSVWNGMKRSDAVASAAIHKARQVIDGVVPDDTGTALSDAATAIRDSQAQVLDGAIPQVTK